MHLGGFEGKAWGMGLDSTPLLRQFLRGSNKIRGRSNMKGEEVEFCPLRTCSAERMSNYLRQFSTRETTAREGFRESGLGRSGSMGVISKERLSLAPIDANIALHKANYWPGKARKLLKSREDSLERYCEQGHTQNLVMSNNGSRQSAITTILKANRRKILAKLRKATQKGLRECDDSQARAI